MDVIKRKGVHVHRDEKNHGLKATKMNIDRAGGTKTALSNISNIQSRGNNVVRKKKEGNKIIKDKVLDEKTLSRVKSQTSLVQNENIAPPKKDVQVLDEVDESDEELPIAEDTPSACKQLYVEDIDEGDVGNPTLCATYVKDIYSYLHKLERRLLPLDYMQRQTEISKKMRSVLIDWLIQVQCRFNLLQETLYLTVYTIDRFLSRNNVRRSELQLVGVTSMLLASKYEEMYAPEIGDFVYITDNAYTNENIKRMEQNMLRVLEYDLSNPLCLHFLRRISKAGGVNAQTHTLAKYLMELTLVEYNFVMHLPSKVAAAALYLSIKLINNDEWSHTLQHYSEYSEDDLKEVVHEMADLAYNSDTSKHQAVRNKYAANKFLRISKLPQLKSDTLKMLAEPW